MHARAGFFHSFSIREVMSEPAGIEPRVSNFAISQALRHDEHEHEEGVEREGFFLHCI